MQQKPILGQGLPVPPAQPAEAGLESPQGWSTGLPPVPAAPEPGAQPIEIGGRGQAGSNGLDPTRYGDWEKNGRCIDF